LKTQNSNPGSRLAFLVFFRGRGLGRALLAHLAGKAEGSFMEWQVLDWNTPSIEFYKSLGAGPRDSWINYRLQGEALRELAS